MIDLDSLIEEAVVDGQLAAGVPAHLVSARTQLDAEYVCKRAVGIGTKTVPAACAWTKEEDEFLRKNIGYLPEDEIAKRLGRSRHAIKVRRTRKGMPSPSTRPEEIVANQAADMLGMCVKKVIKLIRRGVMPGRKVPGVDRYVINRKALLRWLVNPMNFVYLNPSRIRDRRYRAIVERAVTRWDDEWLTTGQVAEMHGCSVSVINKAVRNGMVPAVRWGNWWVLRSDAEKMVIRPGGGYEKPWPITCDAFVLLCHSIGLPVSLIDVYVGNGMRSSDRLRLLRKNGKDRFIRRRFCIPEFADWRDYKTRFPGVVLAIERFLRQEKMSPLDVTAVRGIMHAWLLKYGRNVPKTMLNFLKYGGGDKGQPAVYRYYEAMKEMGIDPFEGVLEL